MKAWNLTAREVAVNEVHNKLNIADGQLPGQWNPSTLRKTQKEVLSKKLKSFHTLLSKWRSAS